MLPDSAAAPGLFSSCPIIRLLLAAVAYKALARMRHPIADAHVLVWPALSCTSGCSSPRWALCLRRFCCRLQEILCQVLLLCRRRTRPFHARVLRGGRDHRRRQVCAPNASLRL